jgi:hypothetical protein
VIPVDSTGITSPSVVSGYLLEYRTPYPQGLLTIIRHGSQTSRM